MILNWYKWIGDYFQQQDRQIRDILDLQLDFRIQEMITQKYK